MGAGVEALPSGSESGGSWGLQETLGVLPCSERCLMVHHCVGLSVEVLQGRAPREQGEQ